eukprot:PhM_4_TR10233/c0_g1_i1/m.89013
MHFDVIRTKSCPFLLRVLLSSTTSPLDMCSGPEEAAVREMSFFAWQDTSMREIIETVAAKATEVQMAFLPPKGGGIASHQDPPSLQNNFIVDDVQWTLDALAPTIRGDLERYRLVSVRATSYAVNNPQCSSSAVKAVRYAGPYSLTLKEMNYRIGDVLILHGAVWLHADVVPNNNNSKTVVENHSDEKEIVPAN